MKRASKYTRKISPRLGLLGFLGFLGFAGLATYRLSQSFFPFVFFAFFGFFGFYYEGKLSATLMDERFLQNKLRAEHKAYSLCGGISFLALVLTSVAEAVWVPLAGALDLQVSELKLMFLTIVLALTFALGIFLSQYLLYRYDHEDCNESEL